MLQDQLNIQSRPTSAKETVAVAQNPQQAVELALKGSTVLFPVAGGTPQSLGIRPKEGGYEVSLGESRFTLECSSENLADAVAFASQMPKGLGEQLRSLEYLSSDHQKFEAGPSYEIKKTDSDDGKDTTRITVGQGSIDFLAPRSMNDAHVRLQVAQYLSQVPGALACSVKTIEVKDGPNPQDAYWAQQYNMPGFRSAATGGSGTITFYNGTDNLLNPTMGQNYFHHEYGHNIGQRFSSDRELVPDNWETAVREDGEVATNYAKSSPSEAFAEAWATYQDLQSGKRLTRFPNLEEMRQKMPRQTAFIEAVVRGEQRPLR